MITRAFKYFRRCSLHGLACSLAISTFGARCCASDIGSRQNEDVTSLIGWLLEGERELTGIPFSQVVEATTGKKVIPLSTNSTTDLDLLNKVTGALDSVLKELNAPNHPAHQESRINEVSAHFEKALMQQLNSVPGFTCAPPKTAAGGAQRSGYPDLRLEDHASGRVLYIDPKIFAERNRTGSLRTFYFEPKRETNKILDDAHHLIVGFEHAGKRDGRWNFTHWNVADLARFEVKLKAEFQGNNRDLYNQKTLVKSSRETDSRPD